MAGAALPLFMASKGASLFAQSSQSEHEAKAAEMAAKQHDIAVTQREADRKGRLAAALASQNAMSGAKGISAFEGSPLTILQDSMEREKLATERDRFSTNLTMGALKATARNTRRMSNMNSALSLLQSGASLGQIGVNPSV